MHGAATITNSAFKIISGAPTFYTSLFTQASEQTPQKLRTTSLDAGMLSARTKHSGSQSMPIQRSALPPLRCPQARGKF